MSAAASQGVDVRAVLQAVCEGHFDKPGHPSFVDAHKALAAVTELVEREAAMRHALVLAIEKADRIGGDMKYSDFRHRGHPNGECVWYIRACEALARCRGATS